MTLLDYRDTDGPDIVKEKHNTKLLKYGLIC
jgi:hypothetical protein